MGPQRFASGPVVHAKKAALICDRTVKPVVNSALGKGLSPSGAPLPFRVPAPFGQECRRLFAISCNDGALDQIGKPRKSGLAPPSDLFGDPDVTTRPLKVRTFQNLPREFCAPWRWLQIEVADIKRQKKGVAGIAVSRPEKGLARCAAMYAGFHGRHHRNALSAFSKMARQRIRDSLTLRRFSARTLTSLAGPCFRRWRLVYFPLLP